MVSRRARVHLDCGSLIFGAVRACRGATRSVATVQAHAIGGKIYLVGGLNGRQQGQHHVDMYDPLLDTFTKGPQTTAGQFRLRYASAAIGPRIYVSGGLPQNDNDPDKPVDKLVRPHLSAFLSPRLPPTPPLCGGGHWLALIDGNYQLLLSGVLPCGGGLCSG